MAVQTRLSVSMDEVFPSGAFMVGPPEASEDFDLKQAGNQDPQQRDKVSGKRVWNVRVVDADPEARRGQAEVTVKVSADHSPVPPDALPGLPFRPVEFDGLTVTPYVDTNRARPRLAYSIRATGLKTPAKPASMAPRSSERPAA